MEEETRQENNFRTQYGEIRCIKIYKLWRCKKEREGRGGQGGRIVANNNQK